MGGSNQPALRLGGRSRWSSAGGPVLACNPHRVHGHERSVALVCRLVWARGFHDTCQTIRRRVPFRHRQGESLSGTVMTAGAADYTPTFRDGVFLDLLERDEVQGTGFQRPWWSRARPTSNELSGARSETAAPVSVHGPTGPASSDRPIAFTLRFRTRVPPDRGQPARPAMSADRYGPGGALWRRPVGSAFC